MFNIFPYIFSTTLNAVSNNLGLIEDIVDNIINSEFMNNLISEIDNMSPVNINFKEHKRAYTLECYLPGVKKENIDLEYDNNYITLKIKRNMFYTNNKNIAMAVITTWWGYRRGLLCRKCRCRKYKELFLKMIF